MLGHHKIRIFEAQEKQLENSFAQDASVISAFARNPRDLSALKIWAIEYLLHTVHWPSGTETHSIFTPFL